MSAAERGLSELLNNTTNFYAVEHSTHTRKNKIGFSGKTADDRAATFQSNGFVDSTLSFPTSEFKIVLNKTFESENGAYKDKATVVTMRNPTKVKTDFETSINGEVGFHVYYCSIAGANHTMLLVINNSDPCNPTFEMWDQHGLSSSSGSLSNIANGVSGSGGINSQVQWLVRWLRGVKKTNGAAKADEFYPQLTCNFYKIKRK